MTDYANSASVDTVLPVRETTNRVGRGGLGVGVGGFLYFLSLEKKKKRNPICSGDVCNVGRFCGRHQASASVLIQFGERASRKGMAEIV